VNFAAIDFETANSDPGSVCQVGIATFRNGVPVDLYGTLINPHTHFSPFNITIHGIRPEDVAQAPTWDEIYPEVAQRLAGSIVVSHTNFDRIALNRACELASLEACDCHWADSALITRRTWTQFAQRGYRLPNIAAHLGIDYQAHDALEDARCAGLVVVRAHEISGLEPEKFFRAMSRPLPQYPVPGATQQRRYPEKVTRAGNPDGALSGTVLVFTGELAMDRHEAADLAAAAGCAVEAGVTRRTSILVVGSQAVARSFTPAASRPGIKSAKQVKAEGMQLKGHPIRIYSEEEFQRLMERAGVTVCS